MPLSPFGLALAPVFAIMYEIITRPLAQSVNIVQRLGRSQIPVVQDSLLGYFPPAKRARLHVQLYIKEFSPARDWFENVLSERGKCRVHESFATEDT